jgi:hypothetical protein
MFGGEFSRGEFQEGNLRRGIFRGEFSEGNLRRGIFRGEFSDGNLRRGIFAGGKVRRFKYLLFSKML